MAKKFYLIARDNPQFKKIYYIKQGQLTKAEAKKREQTVYGDNYLVPFDTEQSYLETIDRLKNEGFTVN